MKLLSIKDKEEQYGTTDAEQALLRRAKDGDRAAFEEVVRLYQEKVFKLAYWFFHNPEDAMEIVQETFLRIYRSLDSFREGTNFGSWLYRVAANLCIDYYRKFKKRRPEVSAPVVVTDDPESQLSRQILNDQINSAVAGLAKQEKMVFVLKHFSHLKYRQIAEVLNISVGTVKSTHHRALVKVRRGVMPPER
jgi:RNA polymerase sigma-70 factor (ECF subfamily)